MPPNPDSELGRALAKRGRVWGQPPALPEQIDHQHPRPSKKWWGHWPMGGSRPIQVAKEWVGRTVRGLKTQKVYGE